jgi:hypothetical protein
MFHRHDQLLHGPYLIVNNLAFFAFVIAVGLFAVEGHSDHPWSG